VLLKGFITYNEPLVEAAHNGRVRAFSAEVSG
jgi:hypothetical protein